MKNKKALREKKTYSLLSVYVFGTAIAVLSTLISFAVSRGELVSSFFFCDSFDTGMDFFNSLVESSTRDPYVQYDTMYPPLANLIFYGLSLFVEPVLKSTWGFNHHAVVEMRNTWCDLRTHQTTFLLFASFFIVTLVGLLYLIEYIEQGSGHEKLFAVSCCLSYGVLYGFERGNIILFVLLLTLFFLEFYESPNPILREASLIALAIAAGIKLYPATFGILLLIRRKWWTAARTVLYGMLAFVLPALFFGGVSGINEFIRCFFLFGNDQSSWYWSIGIDRILVVFFRCLEILGYNISHRTMLAVVAKFFIVLLYLTSAMAAKEKWRQCLYLALLLLFIQTSYSYTLVFLLPAFIFLCGEKEKKRWIPEFLCMMAMLLPIPVTTIQFGLTTANVIDICCMTMLTIVTVFRQIQNITERKEKNEIMDE